MNETLHVVTNLGQTHLRPLVEQRVRELGRFHITHLDADSTLPRDLDADALLTIVANPNLPELLRDAEAFDWVHVLGTGVDGFPFQHLGGRLLTCSRGASAVPIAEWVVAMMLAAVKRLPESWVDSPPEQWYRAPLTSLHGQRLGLIGLGHIGRAVVDRADVFGMHIQALVRQQRRGPPPKVEIAASLEALMSQADHVVIAAAATPETHHLIDSAALAHARPGLHLINIARGSLIDQEALRSALEQGVVSRASLDVVEPEPLPPGHWMYDHPAVYLSPHVSWNSPGIMERLVDGFIDNLQRRLRDETLEGIVDTAAGY